VIVTGPPQFVGGDDELDGDGDGELLDDVGDGEGEVVVTGCAAAAADVNAFCALVSACDTLSRPDCAWVICCWVV